MATEIEVLINLKELIEDTIPDVDCELKNKLHIRLENYLCLALDIASRKALDYGLTLGGINANFVINGLPIQTISEQQENAETPDYNPGGYA